MSPSRVHRTGSKHQWRVNKLHSRLRIRITRDSEMNADIWEHGTNAQREFRAKTLGQAARKFHSTRSGQTSMRESTRSKTARLSGCSSRYPNRQPQRNAGKYESQINPKEQLISLSVYTIRGCSRFRPHAGVRLHAFHARAAAQQPNHNRERFERNGVNLGWVGRRGVCSRRMVKYVRIQLKENSENE